MVKIQVSHKSRLAVLQRDDRRIRALTPRPASRTFSVYLRDRQAKQSERSLHTDAGTSPKKEEKQPLCVRPEECVCLPLWLSVGVRLLKWSAVKCARGRMPTIKGYTFTRTLKGGGGEGGGYGAWPFGTQFKQRAPPPSPAPSPSIHSFRSLSKAFPLEAKWKLPQQ